MPRIRSVTGSLLAALQSVVGVRMEPPHHNFAATTVETANELEFSRFTA